MKQKKLQSILQNNILNSLTSNYHFANDFLIKLPIEDILIGFCFERSSTKDERYIWWFTLPLYYSHEVIGLTFGNRMRTNERSQVWDFSDYQIDHTIKVLLPQLILQERVINDYENPLNFYNTYYKKRNTNLRIYEAITHTACWLGLPTMRNQIEDCINFIKNENDASIPWVNKILNNMNLLQDQKSNEDILEVLKNWKATTLKELKLK